ncbi:HypC/HybG/HupF family hydrogenase formation chaperone [Streptomyces violascens]|uniref:HypC/HybG/HupF family hydrogenase formation chaperone n=1 Tax=Streptomyces violascens TaxID=67381 RepID=UPI00367C3342
MPGRSALRFTVLGTIQGSVGTYVIVHVGFTITEVDETEARRTLEVRRAMARAVEGELGEPLPGAG